MNPAHANCVPNNRTYPYWDGSPNYGDATPWTPDNPVVPWVPDIPITQPGTGTATWTYTAPKTRILYTGGTFDLFHYGHVNFLRACKAVVGEGGQVVVALNPDEFVRRFKGVDPTPYEHRKMVLEACEYVDRVVENQSAEDSKPTIKSVRPDFVAIGSDWAKKDYYKQMNFTQEWLDQQGIILIYLPYTQGISSTTIREQLGRL